MTRTSLEMTRNYILIISTSPSRPTLMIWEALPVESVSMEGGTTKSTASLISCGISLNGDVRGCGHDRPAELERKVAAEIEQRDAHAHGTVLRDGVPGEVPTVAGLPFHAGLRVRINDRHRLVIDLHEVHRHGRNLPHVFRDHIQVGGEEDQRLGLAPPLDGIDLRHGFGVRGVAAQAPDGVGGIQDRAAGPEGLQGLGKDFIAFHSRWQ